MGPITLFDKSFIESLTVNESVWFDQFFFTNVCPLLYAEILADLEKKPHAGKSPEDTVRIVAEKIPILHSVASAHHNDLCIANLMGTRIEMSGQIQAEQSRRILYDGNPIPENEYSPILQSLDRWKNKKFTKVERDYALLMRQRLAQADIEVFPEMLTKWPDFNKKCKSPQEAKEVAFSFIETESNPELRMELCFQLLEIPQEFKFKIRSRWEELHFPPLNSFAQYAAYVLALTIFLFLAIREDIIPSGRRSNVNDILYFYYLPFCEVFVSSDKLHKKIAPLYMRSNQKFVYGPDLKNSLREINIFFSQYPIEVKEQGLYAFAQNPPKFIPTLVSELWDSFIPGWRINDVLKIRQTNDVTSVNSKDGQNINNPSIEISHKPGTSEISQSVIITRKIQRSRGSWYLIPKHSK